MTPGRRWYGVALMLTLVAGAALAQPAQSVDPVPDAAVAGRKLYVMSCQRCHGINLATNGIGSDLRSFPPDGKERFVRSVTNGLRAMPAWSGVLQPEQIAQLWAYIGAVNGWKAATPE